MYIYSRDFYIMMHQRNKKGEGLMSTLVNETVKMPKIKSKFNDEFENYLKNQCLKTTFNGVELETFSWYKKVLGLI